MPTARKRTAMTEEHKAALAKGREESRAVRAYLEALERNRPRRGRKRTPESIRRRMGTIDTALEEAAPLSRLQLVQERMDLAHELEQLQAKDDLASLEKAFVKAARGYGERKGISYAAWRELGVAPDVLRQAKIGR